jgi:hypothetical protein
MMFLVKTYELEENWGSICPYWYILRSALQHSSYVLLLLKTDCNNFNMSFGLSHTSDDCLG